jgi:hypothetical protein
METVMHARFVMIAAIALTAGTAAPAEPPTTQAQGAPHPANRPAPPVMLASADQVPTPAPADQGASGPAKPHRAARVTTCRCGGQTAEQPEQ